MKLVSFRYDGRDRIGVLEPESGKIVDIQLALAGEDNVPATMKELLEMGESGMNLAFRAMNSHDETAMIATDAISWLPPVPRPGKSAVSL